MKDSRLPGCLAVVLVFICLHGSLAMAGSRTVTSFDKDWRFLKVDADGAAKPEFDDSWWRTLDVPHDWSIEGPADANNPSRGAGGFFPDGVGWYRRHFELGDADSARKIFVDFDSVMANSDVWINGHPLGHRPYGYVPLHYELTGHLNFGAGKTNILAVRVDQSAQPASRYYMGAGIIGHVNLLAVEPVHLEHHGLFVTTPRIDADSATVRVQTTIVNGSDSDRKVRAHVEFLDPDGKAMTMDAGALPAQLVAAGKSAEFSQDLSIPNPRLWDLEHPQLYTAKITVMDGDAPVDTDATTFGIRTIKFDAATGFSLNGKNIRIQGVCLHADASCFGTSVPLAAWERRLAALKSIGVNGLRTAHNPPSPEFLDLCDRMGFLVMDEMFDCWDVAKNPYDYHLYFDKWSLTDLRDTVRRDRNHPSIILYSAGNEIHDTPNAAASIRILTGLVKEFHANDPTRPVTQALLRPNRSHDYDDGLADLLDVIGTNYRMTELMAAQRAKPSRLLIGTENHSSDVPFLADHAQLSGIFIWAGVDYLGEAQRWPQFSSGSGLLDRTDEPKAGAYLAAATWSGKPFVKIFRGVAVQGRGLPPQLAPGAAGDDPTPTTQPAMVRPIRGGGRGPTADWTPDNLNPHPETVTVYSNCPKITLTLNGKVLSENPPGRENARGAHVFTVPFTPGSLKAIGHDESGTQIITNELRTAGPAAKIALTTETTRLPNDWNDVAFVRATVTDADGITVPGTNQEITFSTTGPGVIAAVDSADNRYHEPFQAAQRQAFEGSCLAAVKATADSGKISITASSPGLTPATLVLEATPPVR